MSLHSSELGWRLSVPRDVVKRRPPTFNSMRCFMLRCCVPVFCGRGGSAAAGRHILRHGMAGSLLGWLKRRSDAQSERAVSLPLRSQQHA
mmetsp:Transcript_97277/g.245429  ORF Transcript_97277/g.245429 Transcript_97277/m.245429 type:complete len:90 (+) Transcript_97277:2714-2983(+)